MTQYNYPTAFTSWGDEEQEAIQRVIASGRFTMGAEVEAFEAELAQYHGVKHCVMVNSGSSANLVAVAALFHVKDNPLRRGFRAVVPALAWATTYAPLVQYGLDLILADCDQSWNANTLPDFADGDIHLIVAASILGTPCNLPYWQGVARRNAAYLIEDNCESLGASIAGKKCGTFGKMGTLSFFYSHQLSAIEGGAVLTDDDECAYLCRLLRNHGWTKGLKKPASLSEESEFVLMGYNLRPLEMHAAIGRAQLRKIDGFVDSRLFNARVFWNEMELAKITKPASSTDIGASPFGIHFAVSDEATRQNLATALRWYGIDCRPAVGGSFGLQPYGKAWAHQKTPQADLIHRTGMMIGNPPFTPRGATIQKIASIMRGVL